MMKGKTIAMVATVSAMAFGVQVDAGAPPADRPWIAFVEQETGKGPGGEIEITDWQPLDFYESHQAMLDWGPHLSWEPVASESTIRRLGKIAELVFYEVVQLTRDADPWDVTHRMTLLAGPSSNRLRPVHILLSNQESIRRVEPSSLIAVGEAKAATVTYIFQGTGNHTTRRLYSVHDGKPIDLRLREILWWDELPSQLADDWLRWQSPHHRWSPPGHLDHPEIDLESLTGHFFLASVDGNRFCWFKVRFNLVQGQLAMGELTLTTCPACDWCADGKTYRSQDDLF